MDNRMVFEFNLYSSYALYPSQTVHPYLMCALSSPHQTSASISVLVQLTCLPRSPNLALNPTTLKHLMSGRIQVLSSLNISLSAPQSRVLDASASKTVAGTHARISMAHLHPPSGMAVLPAFGRELFPLVRFGAPGAWTVVAGHGRQA
jgi:hypothetical protein